MKTSNQAPEAVGIPKDKKNFPEENIDDLGDPEERNRIILDDDDDFDIALDDDLNGFDEFEDDEDENDDDF
ncbi:MAG: hypothetical protein ACYCZO_11085 [Daejeonella sp.]